MNVPKNPVNPKLHTNGLKVTLTQSWAQFF